MTGSETPSKAFCGGNGTAPITQLCHTKGSFVVGNSVVVYRILSVILLTGGTEPAGGFVILASHHGLCHGESTRPSHARRGSRAGSVQGGQGGFATRALPPGVAVRGLLSRGLLRVPCHLLSPFCRAQSPSWGHARHQSRGWALPARCLLQPCPSHSAPSITPTSPVEPWILLRGAGFSRVSPGHLPMFWAGTRCSQSVPRRYPWFLCQC